MCISKSWTSRDRWCTSRDSQAMLRRLQDLPLVPSSSYGGRESVACGCFERRPNDTKYVCVWGKVLELECDECASSMNGIFWTWWTPSWCTILFKCCDLSFRSCCHWGCSCVTRVLQIASRAVIWCSPYVTDSFRKALRQTENTNLSRLASDLIRMGDIFHVQRKFQAGSRCSMCPTSSNLHPNLFCKIPHDQWPMSTRDFSSTLLCLLQLPCKRCCARRFFYETVAKPTGATVWKGQKVQCLLQDLLFFFYISLLFANAQKIVNSFSDVKLPGGTGVWIYSPTQDSSHKWRLGGWDSRY